MRAAPGGAAGVLRHAADDAARLRQGRRQRPPPEGIRRAIAVRLRPLRERPTSLAVGVPSPPGALRPTLLGRRRVGPSPISALTKAIEWNTFKIKFSMVDKENIHLPEIRTAMAAPLLAPDEIERLERERGGGISSREVVRLFEAKGARLSASTFRKYVQVGLLPRSRRVGRKGKHTGSSGVYPIEVVRRVNLIKRMMAEGMTIEDIRGSFVALKNRLDDVERGFSALLGELSRKARQHPQRRQMELELGRAEREVRDALARIERVGGKVARGPAASGAGPAG